MPRRRARPETLCKPTSRDFVMARVAACRASLQTAIDELDEAMGHFVDPSEDEDGDERTEALEAATESIGSATRSLEAGMEVWTKDDDVSLLEDGEAHLEDEDDDDDEEDADEEPS